MPKHVEEKEPRRLKNDSFKANKQTVLFLTFDKV